MRLYDGTLRAAGEDVEETFAEPDSATGSFPSQPPLAGPALSGRRGTKAMKSTVAAIILNWNDWPNTLVCLESVWRSDYDDFEVAVCDNGSSLIHADRTIADACRREPRLAARAATAPEREC